MSKAPPAITPAGLSQRPLKWQINSSPPPRVVSLHLPIFFDREASQQQKLGCGPFDYSQGITRQCLYCHHWQDDLPGSLTFAHRTADAPAGRQERRAPPVTDRRDCARPSSLCQRAWQSHKASSSSEESRRTEISSRLQSFSPLSINKPQMVFSLSEDHSAPGKPKSGRVQKAKRRNSFVQALYKLRCTPLISSKCSPAWQ